MRDHATVVGRTNGPLTPAWCAFSCADASLGERLTERRTAPGARPAACVVRPAISSGALLRRDGVRARLGQAAERVVKPAVVGSYWRISVARSAPSATS